MREPLAGSVSEITWIRFGSSTATVRKVDGVSWVACVTFSCSVLLRRVGDQKVLPCKVRAYYPYSFVLACKCRAPSAYQAKESSGRKLSYHFVCA
jgi:hypothetical protein